MLSNPSQLVVRNLAELDGPQLLLINPPADGLLQQLSAEHKLSVLDQNYQRYQHHVALASDDINVAFRATLEVSKRGNRFDQVIVFASKEKSLTEFNLAMVATHLPATAKLWLAGENKAGIKSSGKLLQRYFGSFEKLDSARHCTLFEAGQPKPTAEFSMEHWLSFFPLEVASGALQIAALPGVFSQGRLDQGTAVLLAHLPDELAGRGLDYGCGSGVIASVLLQRDTIAAMDMIDVNALALAASRATLQRNQLDGRLIAGDSLDAAANGYDFIVSNPPFHQGVSIDYRATERFLEEAKNHLRPHGQLLIVANAFLDYQQRLKRSFGNVDTLASEHGFRVYQARRT